MITLRKNKVRTRIYVLCLYLALLPIDATLGNILGSISIINYIAIIYILIRSISLFREKIKVDVIRKSRIPALYFLYFFTSISWSQPLPIGTWYIFSLLGAFLVFLLASLDTYSDIEYKLMKKNIILSGLIVIVITYLSLDLSSGARFNLNVGRYMDPNYFATGFILITAVLADNVLKKVNVKRNTLILVLIFLIIIMTGSRGGLLANLAVIIVSFVIDKRSEFKKLSLVLLLTLGFLILFYFFQDIIPNWVLNRFTLNEVLSGGGSGRFRIWDSNISYFKEQSFLRVIFGTGFSTFSSVSLRTMGMPKVAHSIYVQSIVEGGLIGITLLMLMFFSTLKRLWMTKNRAIFAAVIGTMIGGIFLDIHVSRFFWVIFLFSIILPNKSNILAKGYEKS